MGNRGARNAGVGYGDPYLNQYGAGYGYGGQPGLGGYGAYGPGYTITTPPAFVEEPWAVTQWTEYYVPTVVPGRKRPVIYVAAPLPAANPCGGFGGFGGGLGGFGGGLGGFGGGLGGLGGGLGGLGGGFGGGLPIGGGLGGFGGGFGGNLGYQVLPMMTVGYGGGIPGVGGFGGGLGGLGGGLGGFGGGLGGLGGGYGGLGGGYGGGLPLF